MTVSCSNRTTAILCCFAVVLFSPAWLGAPFSTFAQSTAAGVYGRVVDQSGAVIADAEVEIRNTQTGQFSTVKTNRDGLYTIPSLQPGHYLINVRKPGFKSVTVTEVELNIQDNVVRNFALQVGSVSETVTITADQNNINTTDGTVSTVIDQSYVANMPLNGRSFQDLILLTPGVVTTTPQSGSGIGGTGEFSVNGQRTEENYYTVDGVGANVGMGAPPGDTFGSTGGVSGSLPGSTALGTTQGLVSVDSLQEFRVQSSSYSAEYGHSPGGQFAFVTKSGTNEWHGSAFEYFRNGDFDAADWFNNYYGIPYPSIHQNDFGGTLGGPVSIPHLYDGKDKTFFFVSYEGLRLRSPQPASTNYVPDAALRASASPDILPVLNAWPAANGLDLGSGIAEYIGSWSNPSSINSTSVRLDQALGQKTNLFFRFSDTGSSATMRPSGLNTQSVSDPKTTSFTLRTYTLGANTAFTGRISNELRFNYSANDVDQLWKPDGFAGATPVNMAEAASLDPGAFMNFYMLLGPYEAALSAYNETSAQKQWNLIDTVSFSAGHHGLKFGVDYRRLTPSVKFPSEQGSWVFFGGAEVQTNSPAYTGTSAYAPAYPLYTNFALFAEDEWRVSQRLSLSLGLRWEVNPPPGVTKGEKFWTMTGLDDPNTATLAPYGTPLWHTTWFNFAPRLGAAYIARGASGRETVVRAGGGVFFDSGQQLGSLFFGPGTSVGTPAVPGAYPLLPPAPSIVQPTPPYLNINIPVNGYAPHLQLPYTLQWNVSVQQALGQAQSFTLSYVGSHASRLLVTNFIQPSDNPFLMANGQYFYYLIQNGNTADYEALQAQFQRRISAGLTALASYTFSHCLDYGSSNLLFGYQRGNCDFDVRHNFSAAASYDIPFPGQNAFAKAILSHWGVDDRFIARTGFPVGISGNAYVDPDGRTYDSGASLVPGQAIYIYGANCASTFQSIGGLGPGQGCPGGRAINPNAFVSVSTGLGDAPRNFVRGFGAWQMNLAVRREFPIHERLKLQFRAEAFNVFNHPSFGAINNGVGGSTFGLATATLANSLGTLNPLYQLGGPRSMQFALKLIF
jgi:hypothetical protein